MYELRLSRCWSRFGWSCSRRAPLREFFGESAPIRGGARLPVGRRPTGNAQAELCRDRTTRRLSLAQALRATHRRARAEALPARSRSGWKLCHQRSRGHTGNGRGLRRLGYLLCDDVNAPDNQPGIFPLPLNARDGMRVSTNDAYLEPARSRDNFKLIGGVPVERVELDRTRARGVWAQTKEGPVYYEAEEVILCAGTIHSPAILMRSGIGRADDLLSLGIRPVVDLPGVGQ